MQTLEKGRLVILDGMPRAGKSSTFLKVADELEERTTAPSRKIIYTREPGGTDLAEKLRPLILSSTLKLTPLEESYLFATARVSNNQGVVIPALEGGFDVYKDRSVEASYAFQGAGYELGYDVVHQINIVANLGIASVLTVIFDISYEVMRGRAIDPNDKFEQKEKEYMERVRERYLSLRQESNCRIIDGAASRNEVRLQFLRYLEEFHLIE